MMNEPSGGPDRPVSGPPREFWEQRYAEPEYAYGTKPNVFLTKVAHRIPPGPVLCLAEGEGRNAVWLAARGHAVTAVDSAAAGIEKTRRLAAERRVRVNLVAADLADYEIAPGYWSGVVAIFAHLPPQLRRRVHRAAAAGLVPGGAFVLEAFTPRQLAFASGGPREAAMLYALEELREDLEGLRIEIGRELERELREGRYHAGRAAVAQVLARRV